MGEEQTEEQKVSEKRMKKRIKRWNKTNEREKRRKNERNTEKKIFCYSVRVFLTGQADQSGFKVRYRDGRGCEGEAREGRRKKDRGERK